MKRTEKIEIRLSQEEKTALTELAEKEERTVSRLVRDVVSKYVDLNSARIPSKFRRNQFVALFGLSAVLGFGASSALSVADNSEIFRLHGQVNGTGFDTPLHRKAKKPQRIDIKTKSGIYQLEAKFISGEKLSHLTLSVCEKLEDGCNEVSTDTLILHPKKQSSLSSQNEMGHWNFIVEGPHYNKNK